MRMADFKAFWQRFKSGENGGKGQKDRFMLLALVGLLILVAVWPVGGKSGKTSGQTEASVEKKQDTSYNYAESVCGCYGKQVENPCLRVWKVPEK